ncbi:MULTISPECIES: pyrroline-5-carboxylate reductase [unclassified Bosea (in: a-proteobacteria)]|uniref:pyrroline-5-carboxylate reductase n=1 Tax=unclassified Bosea (in: a-proteobacteria) TaxID=2653178 RepID=UPI000956BD0F|nr:MULTISPECIES: pyrroline-5-carboxylate reductase [unclassified Bosea (in: a-proteobacteria)]TAJ31304.1 MAG: pyrroline-5-carboxylate reductase [Bosea sp. (in: a-proteobacteria)]SIQ33455.1 pyrroline-5-carboxylate reductase [Bosea sp. TND4EK4]
MSAPLPQSLVLIGAGKMGGAMLEGWLRIGIDPKAISLIDPKPSDEMVDLAAEKGMLLNPSAKEIKPAEVVVLATKPQMLDTAAPAVQAFIHPKTLLISILAGKTIGDLSARLPGASAIIRAMPNLPASVQRGATAATPGKGVSSAQMALADALLSSIGKVEWLDNEGLIDAVTAVSGSGPAYVFHMVECLAKAGTEAGLPPDVAERLARATVEGAGELLFQSPLPPATLRQNVTSPGGTTAAALEVLMAQDGLGPLMGRAVAAAKRRAGELSG